MSNDENTYYKVQIQTWASPKEVHEFTTMLENKGYEVVTDLEYGKIKIREKNDD